MDKNTLSHTTPEAGNIRKNQGRRSPDTQHVMQEKGCRNNRGRSMSGPYTYARPDTAEYKRIGFHGISEGEKFANDLRPARESKVQVRQPKILVPGILRRYGRKKRKKDRRIYTKPISGRSSIRSNEYQGVRRPVYG